MAGDRNAMAEKAQLRWAIKVLNEVNDMTLDEYLLEVNTSWPLSSEYKQLQLDLAFGTLDEIEAEIEAEIRDWENEGGYHGDETNEVRSEDEPGRPEDTEMG